MRKSAIGILLLMCSCTTTLPLDIGQGERVLMLNAQWDSADQEHLAYAGLSAQAALKPLDEACVRCFVDGSPVALADHSIRNVSNQACFSLQADLPPGSRLRLELEQGSERAGSEIVVPVKAGEILGVDMQRSGDRAVFKIDIRDLSPDRNYFRLRIIHKYDYSLYRRNPEGEMVLVAEEKGSVDLPLSHDSDPVLHDGKMGGSLDERFFDDAFSNRYSIFSDRLFPGGTCTLTASLDANRLYSFHVGEVYDRIRVSHQAEIRLETIPLATFDYLVALDRLESGRAPNASLVEPAVLPSNVTGGTGFVSVSTSDTVTLDLGGLAY